MRTKIRELRQKRAKLIADARALLDAAEAEERDLTEEENNQYDQMLSDADELRERYERMERQLELESNLDQPAGDDPVHTNIPPSGGPGGPNEDDDEERRMRAFGRFLPAWIANDLRSIPPDEYRALQADLDVSGGYLQPPQQFVNQLIQAVDDMVFIRGMANTFTVVNADSLGVPTLENDPADANWTTELATGSEDSTMDFGKRELHPHPLAKRLKISRKLIRAVPNSEQIVRERLAYKFGITQEKAFLTGSGANQPLGVFTASSLGISTSRDVSTGNDATSIKFDGLINAKYTLKGAYWPRARWIFHRDGMKQIAGLKDGNGQYLWRESVRVGEPDRVLGLPVNMSEYAPNTFTSGQYVGIVGDFMNYWIADALTFELQLLLELYAATNQVGLIGRLESDGMPVLEEAFVRVKLG